MSWHRDENRRIWEQLSAKKRNAYNLVSVVARLYDVVDEELGSGSGLSLPFSFLTGELI